MCDAALLSRYFVHPAKFALCRSFVSCLYYGLPAALWLLSSRTYRCFTRGVFGGTHRRRRRLYKQLGNTLWRYPQYILKCSELPNPPVLEFDATFAVK